MQYFERKNCFSVTDTQSWWKSWSPNGYNHTRVQLNLHRRRKRVHESFSTRRKIEKSLVFTILWNLANLVKNYFGIFLQVRFTVLRQIVLLRERCAKLRKELHQYCCNQAWTKNGKRVPCNVTVICEMSKTFSNGKTRHERRFGEPLKGQVIPFGSMVECHYFCERPVKAPSIW